MISQYNETACVMIQHHKVFEYFMSATFGYTLKMLIECECECD